MVDAEWQARDCLGEVGQVPAAVYLAIRKRQKPHEGAFGVRYGHAGCFWLRGQDLNLRPSGYEPDELPGCSTPRHPVFAVRQKTVVFAFGKSLCDEPCEVRRVLRAHCLCNLSRVRVAPEARRAALRASRIGSGPLIVSEKIVLRFADLAATYSPAS